MTFSNNNLGLSRCSLVLVLLVIVFSETSYQVNIREEHILGSSVHLKCPSNIDKPIRTSVWEFNGKNIVTDNNKYTVGKKRITISRLDLRDKGLYKCTLRFYNSSKTIRNHIDLDVLYPPVILKKPSSSPVMQGADLTLSCMADGNPAIKYEWLKEKMITELIRAKVKLSENNQNLTIAGIKKTDEGRYFCKVSNSLGIKETFVDVKILIPPSVKLSSSKIHQAENTSVNLVCETSGIPMPKLSWVINSRETMSSSEHSIRLQPGVGILSIHSLKRAYSGNITCQATNSAGFNSSSVFLTVQYPPEVSTETQEVRAWPGLDLVLSCNISSEPPAHITWFKDKMAISSDTVNTSVSNLHVSKQMVTSTLMTTVDSELEEESTYTCEGRNTIGRGETNILVQKEALPEKPEIEFIDEGHESVRIIMRCHDNNSGDHDDFHVIDSQKNYDEYDESRNYDDEDVDSNKNEYVVQNEKFVKTKPRTNKKDHKIIPKSNIIKETLNEDNSEKDFKNDKIIKGNKDRFKLPLLYWKVSIVNTEDFKRRTIIFPYANEIVLDKLTASVMYNVSIVVSNFVGYSAPLLLQVYTSDAPVYAIDKNVSLFGSKKTSNKFPIAPSNLQTDVASGFGFIVLVGIGSVIVLVVIFVLIGLVLYWQKRSLEKAKLLGKCPQHNVVTTLTRHDLESQKGEQETLKRRGGADVTREASTAHLSPTGYYRGDSVDDVIDHLNSSFCNK